MGEALNKATVAQFLEAVKSSLNHLSQLKMQHGEGGRKNTNIDERELLQMYSRVRRIREYLRRWMSAYPTPDDISLPKDDLNLLCSCLVFELSLTDKRVSEEHMKAKDDVAWLEKRKEILSVWTIELATEPIEQLPTNWARNDVNYEVRQVLVAVRNKTTGKAAGSDMPSGIYRIGGKQEAAINAIETDGSGIAPALVATTAPRSTMRTRDIVDTSRVRDYRLRLAMALDVRAYERSVQAEDYRVATVLLDSILEGIVLDYGLANSSTLDLRGAPASWPTRTILESLLEGEFGDRERAASQLLEKSRSLFRPGEQLDNPMVVNKATLHAASTFVARVAEVVGLVGDRADPPARVL